MNDRSPNAEPEALACMEVRGGNVPADVALDMPGLSMHILSRPYKGAEGGGDLHFVSSCGTGRITRLLVADVAGHGADVGATAKMLHGLVYRYVNHIDPRRLVEKINDAFAALTRDGVFATAIVGTYFAPRRELSLINAGHPPPILFRAATGRWSMLEDADDVTETNFPLGVVTHTIYEKIDVRLEPGDAVICYTDSLPESRDAEGELIGYPRLLALANGVAMQRRSDLWLKTWLASIDAISPGNLLADDLTVVYLRAAGPPDRAKLGPQLAAAAKVIGRCLTGRQAIPWPQASIRNLVGAVFPWVGRR